MDFEFTQDWPVERTQRRIKELDEELVQISREMSSVDKRIEYLTRKKERLSKRMSANMRYKNAMVDDLTFRSVQKSGQ